ncbi:hypothetical protein D3C76_1077940 [compost metagenome]
MYWETCEVMDLEISDRSVRMLQLFIMVLSTYMGSMMQISEKISRVNVAFFQGCLDNLM